jgi:hypothetical protein
VVVLTPRVHLAGFDLRDEVVHEVHADQFAGLAQIPEQPAVRETGLSRSVRLCAEACERFRFRDKQWEENIRHADPAGDQRRRADVHPANRPAFRIHARDEESLFVGVDDSGGEILDQLPGGFEAVARFDVVELVDEFAYAACGISKLMRTSGLCRIEERLFSKDGSRDAA